MRALLIITYCILSSNGKFIKKKTEKNHTIQSTEPPSPVRISRQAYYDDGFGISREDILQVEDYVRKERFSINAKSGENFNSVRVSRNSINKRPDTKESTKLLEKTKDTRVLIKKPIPKFSEIDPDDFQVKVSRLPVKCADSGEHEDEDFNLDDYEFDVGHDEFAGRGKPLEPRVKPKESKPDNKIVDVKLATVPPPPEFKIQSKVVIPTSYVKRNIRITRKPTDNKEDYYDDVTTTTKEPETRGEVVDEFSDDNEDSKEDTRKRLVRVARSPWNVLDLRDFSDRIGEKAASVLASIRGYMPVVAHHFNSISKQVNKPLVNLMTGTDFVF